MEGGKIDGQRCNIEPEESKNDAKEKAKRNLDAIRRFVMPSGSSASLV